MGASLVGACCAIVLVSMWFLHPGDAVARLLVVQAVTAVLALVFGLALAATRPGSPSLLVFPALIAGSLSLDRLASQSVALAYTGVLTIGFIYVGLTQRRWTSLPLVPVAALVWWYCQVGPPAVLRVKLAIAMAIWALVAELLSARSTRLRFRLGELTTESETDFLTGLGNRRALDAALDTLAPRDMVVVLDLDHFKDVNDSLGHAAGDRMIADFAKATAATCRANDRAFRLGGEELVVLLAAGDGTANGGGSFCARLRELWTGHGRPTFSAGACLHGAASAAATMSRADAALYAAKQAGRDCFRIAEDVTTATRSS